MEKCHLENLSKYIESLSEASTELFTFTGILVQKASSFSAICPELDIAAQGPSANEARQMLVEAATLHLHGSFEDGLPYLRPIPPAQDPRLETPELVLDVFSL